MIDFDYIILYNSFGDFMRDILLQPEQIIEIDLHEMPLWEARLKLEDTINQAPEYVKEVVVIHGYHKGQAILKMVRTEFKHKRIKGMHIGINNGETVLLLY